MIFLRGIGLSLLLLTLLDSAMPAQLNWIPVPSCGDDLTKLGNDLKTETKPDFVLRDAAIGGEAFIPILRTLTKPGQPLDSTVAGAAQVALARLGDQRSLSELAEEIQSSNIASVLEAIRKLSQVHNDPSLTILMQYLIRNKTNLHRVKIEGDVGEDPMIPVLKGLIAMVGDPPYTRPFLTDPHHLSEWEKWWKTTQPPWITSVSQGLPDAKSRCLARLGEGGAAEAPRELYLLLGNESVPALEKLAHIGNPILGDKEWPTSQFGSVRGNAQSILAKAGDEDQFERIAKELDEPGNYGDAIKKLKYIASNGSFEALLLSLSLSTFPKDRYYAPDNTLHYVGEKLQKDVMVALSEMVVNPPLPPDAPATDANIDTWRRWWQANREKDVLRKVPF